MSYVSGSFTGAGSPGRFAAGSTRGRIQGSGQSALNYPSPFFDVAHTYLPTSVKQLFKFCRYYFLTNPLINAIVFKMSEYPVTDVVIDHDDPEVVKKWTEYFTETIRFRSFQIECGLDYNCYGNCPVSLSFPFQKYLTCRSCGFSEQSRKIRSNWVYTSNDFRLNCPKCGNVGAATPKDWYYRDASAIRPVRWNIEDVEINYNDISGESTHFYNIPSPLRADITLGKKDVVESMPQIFLQAIRQGKGIIFSKSNLFHMKRATLAWNDRGWGTPLILPVLKDAFYLQLMKKAQEAILLEHIVPLRVLFPQAASGTTDPFTTVNLIDWRDQVAEEIGRWRHDNNYIPIMPLPLGNQSIGGDGKALLLSGEMQMMGEQIIMGMGVPREFLQGGLSYAGTNVSMRMLENAFLSYIGRQRQMANWLMNMVAHFMGWPKASIRFKPFKMADDLQRKSYLFQLNQAQKISDTTLLADADLNQKDENEIMRREMSERQAVTKKQQIAMAEVQGESSVIMMKMQMKAQQAMMEAQQAPNAPGEPGGPEGAPAEMMVGAPPPAALPPGPLSQQMQSSVPASAESGLNTGQDLGMPPEKGQGQVPVDLVQLAEGYAAQIAEMPPEQQAQAIQAIYSQSEELGQLVEQFLAMVQKGTAGQAISSGVDDRPLPDKLPARRTTQLV